MTSELLRERERERERERKRERERERAREKEREKDRELCREPLLEQIMEMADHVRLCRFLLARYGPQQCRFFEYPKKNKRVSYYWGFDSQSNGSEIHPGF